MAFEEMSAALAAESKADEAQVALAVSGANQLLTGGEVTADKLKAWWLANRANICKWSKRVQSFPFSIFGFVKHLGQLAQTLVQLVDRFFGITNSPCT